MKRRQVAEGEAPGAQHNIRDTRCGAIEATDARPAKGRACNSGFARQLQRSHYEWIDYPRAWPRAFHVMILPIRGRVAS